MDVMIFFTNSTKQKDIYSLFFVWFCFQAKLQMNSHHLFILLKLFIKSNQVWHKEIYDYFIVITISDNNVPLYVTTIALWFWFTNLFANILSAQSWCPCAILSSIKILYLSQLCCEFDFHYLFLKTKLCNKPFHVT